ncbi:hypothetical protein MED297_20887 [Reinekea sp. MED297]|uniref:Uncharacterized protein n=1 Tax=Reinekea blandensis MED297 TaxID=314283 RepID=A4B9T2_9GAMM|nr:hypothetical protein MED297_20887 [Reinekea sp. MED297] [Reinekea blandensis MED297]
MIGVVTPRLDQCPGFFARFLALSGFGVFMHATFTHNRVTGVPITLWFFRFHVISYELVALN